MGQWLFTGSQEAPLMQRITESMAGRAAILQLLPFSVTETPKVNMLHGGFPEGVVRPKSPALWFASYLQSHLERDGGGTFRYRADPERRCAFQEANFAVKHCGSKGPESPKFNSRMLYH